MVYSVRKSSISRFIPMDKVKRSLEAKLMEIVISTLEVVLASSRQRMEKLFLLLTCHHGKTFSVYDKLTVYHIPYMRFAIYN